MQDAIQKRLAAADICSHTTGSMGSTSKREVLIMGRKSGLELLADGVFGMAESVVRLIGCFVPYGEAKDSHVERGSDFWGHKYKKRHGICFRCNGTGYVRGNTCRKCGGSGQYSHTTWYS